MKIGVDLDGVVFDSEKEYRVYSELYDFRDLNKNSKVNNKEVRFQERFKWTKEEIAGFLKKRFEVQISDDDYDYYISNEFMYVNDNAFFELLIL